MKPTGMLLIVLAVLFAGISCSKKMSEKEYFDLAYQYMAQGNYQEAEKYFSQVYEEYPNGVLSSKALFMIGYINANHLNNLEKARRYYTEFLEKYPDHELADDARYELDHLGKNVEELDFLMSDQPQETGQEESSGGQQNTVPAAN